MQENKSYVSTEVTAHSHEAEPGVNIATVKRAKCSESDNPGVIICTHMACILTALQPHALMRACCFSTIQLVKATMLGSGNFPAMIPVTIVITSPTSNY